MKNCPKCRSNYADELIFCLQDGTPLVSGSSSSAETPIRASGDKTEQFASNDLTERLEINNQGERFTTDRDVNQMRIDLPENVPERAWEQSQETQIVSHQTPPKKSNTLVAVLATALGMLLLFGAVGIGAWFYFSGPQNNIAANINKQTNSDDKLISEVNSNKNSAAIPNANIKDVMPSPVPTAQATPSAEFNPEKVKKEVSDIIYSWKSASESLNIDAHLDNYADTVDYYTKKNVSKSFVRSDKQRAFGKYDDIKFDLSNMEITPDETGKNATAVFDKAWDFEGAAKASEGKVRSQLKFSKINGQWKITSERDLKVYFINK